jgi:hypothetical protein
VRPHLRIEIMKAIGFSQSLLAGFVLVAVLSALRPTSSIAAESPIPAPPVNLGSDRGQGLTPEQRQELMAGRIRELELKSNLTATEQSELRSLGASLRAISPVPQSTPGVSAPKPQK